MLIGSDIGRIIISYASFDQSRTFFFLHNIDLAFKFNYDASNLTMKIVQKIVDTFCGVKIVGICVCEDGSDISKFNLRNVVIRKYEVLQLGIGMCLRTIRLNECGDLHNLNCFKECTNLRNLDVRRCGNLVDVMELENFREMRRVLFYKCAIREIPNLGRCRKLKFVEFNWCAKLMGGMGGLEEANKKT